MAILLLDTRAWLRGKNKTLELLMMKVVLKKALSNFFMASVLDKGALTPASHIRWSTLHAPLLHSPNLVQLFCSEPIVALKDHEKQF